MPLHIGVATEDITPDIGTPMAGYANRDHGATAIQDPLKAQALVFGSHELSLAIVCTDLIGVERDTAMEVRKKASLELGIRPEQVMICGSHTHFGPALVAPGYLPEELEDAVSEQYRIQLIDTLADLVDRADASARRAKIGYGTGRAWGINFNRRPVDLDTRQVAMNLTMEPEAASAASIQGAQLADQWPNLGHRGPRLTPPLDELDGLGAGVVDNETPVLRVDGEDGTPIATFVTFACHAVVNSDDHYAISADYPGVARDMVENVVGGSMLFAAGCAGDQVPTWRKGNSRQRVGRALAAEIITTREKIDRMSDEATLDYISREVELPLPSDFPSVKEAKQDLEEFDDTESAAYRMKKRRLQRAEEYAGKESHSRELWAARIGDMAVACTPGETLVEIGLQVKQRSPFAHTAVVSIANDSAPYLCTDDAIEEGGYEPGDRDNPSGPGTEAVLVENLVDMLQDLAQTR